jgi:hypothetical protein
MGLQGQCFATLRHLMQRDSQPAYHTKGGFPQVLPSMAKYLKQVRVRVQKECTSRKIKLESTVLQVLKFYG